jgi:hypothetical protein
MPNKTIRQTEPAPSVADAAEAREPVMRGMADRSRLGRKLTIFDFCTFPQNPGGFGTSERYHRRTVGDKQYERDIVKLRGKAKRKRAASLAGAAIAIMLLPMPTGAHAQQRTIYDASGKVSGRATTDSGGATTVYDAAGRVTGRTSTGSDGTTKFFDAGGRNVGSVTPTKQQSK